MDTTYNLNGGFKPTQERLFGPYTLNDYVRADCSAAYGNMINVRTIVMWLGNDREWRVSDVITDAFVAKAPEQ